MKTIIVTSGPTNERIDDVMKITNMSTGALGARIVEAIYDLGSRVDEPVHIIHVANKMARMPAGVSGVEHIPVESTQDLLDTLRDLLTTRQIDAVVHSAAVGDYKGRYVVCGESLAHEIAGLTRRLGMNVVCSDEYERRLLSVLESPECALDDDTKISSYEPHLMVGLDLTPKVIDVIKATSPGTMLVGFKLLSGVSESELIHAAAKLMKRTGADYIVANDLSGIGDGRHEAIILDRHGVHQKCETKPEIAHAIAVRVLGLKK